MTKESDVSGRDAGSSCELKAKVDLRRLRKSSSADTGLQAQALYPLKYSICNNPTFSSCVNFQHEERKKKKSLRKKQGGGVGKEKAEAGSI